MKTPEEVVERLSRYRFSLVSEKETQAEIAGIIPEASREFPLDYSCKSIVDFFVDGIAIEVKIKGSASQIYRQCKRYCEFEEVKSLILVTNRSMGFPSEINGKPCYVVKLGKGWL